MLSINNQIKIEIEIIFFYETEIKRQQQTQIDIYIHNIIEYTCVFLIRKSADCLEESDSSCSI
jgi:hypothetical protein